jgi:hypothetical protein
MAPSFGDRGSYSYIYTINKKIKVMPIQVTCKSRTLGGKEREVIIDNRFICSSSLAKRQVSKLASKETNDCVVRAFMCALDISYDQAHEWVKEKLFRKNGQGTMVHAFGGLIIGKVKNGYKIDLVGAHPSYQGRHNIVSSSLNSIKRPMLINPKYKKPTGYTLKSFMENNPVGRFVLIVQGHAVAVVNGVLYGNQNEKYEGLYRSVWFAIECK